MQTAIPAGTSFWVRRLFPVTAAMLLFAIGFTQKAAAQSAAAGDPPLNFGTNYFVTGDYVVAGAYGMTTNISNGFATGTINVPDANPAIKRGPAGNPGITGVTQVPPGAQIVAALLYWQTVEKSSATPGGPDTGMNGSFGPVLNGKPQLYPISGLRLPSHMTVSFSNGGCSGGSTGKLVRTYRTDVRGYLPVDANGNVLPNGVGTFQVRLPSSSSTTPITLGATLVLIYRVISPNVPLNSIVIYDGAFAPSATTTVTMSQPVQGFYQAGSGLPSGSEQNPVSKLTHIAGSGQSNKFETVSLNGAQSGTQRHAVALPSLYGNNPAFPGFYGTWDNPTWTFPYQSPVAPPPHYPANPLLENDDSATTTISASISQAGCVSSAAVILSTTVHDDDKDGILKKWKTDQGYTDFATGQHVDLTGAAPGQQDVFIQLDHVVDSNGDFTPDATAVNNVTTAFANHGIHLHITDASITTGIAGANIISEPAVTDGSTSCNGALCPYPNQPGITTWRDGFELLKDQPVNYGTEIDCENNTPPLGHSDCMRRFPPAQRNSHHYVISGDTLGTANWGLLGGLTDSTGTGPGVVVQSGTTTVTFYTSRGHGLKVDANAGNGRVTIANAMTNPVLNGTHLVTGVTCPSNPEAGKDACAVDNIAVGHYSFTITIGNSRTANYTLQTDPYLAVASGQAGAGSGFSDVGGPGTLVTLGQWGALATQRAKAGTLMHELGHTLGLLHGGGDNDNCKSNYQSVMSYFFQSKLLGPSGVLDFSSQQLSTLDEAHLITPTTPITTTDANIAFSTTRWYDTQQTTVTVNGQPVAVGTPANRHCDGTPLSSADTTPYYGYKGGTVPLGTPSELDIPLSNTSLDINFDGKTPGSELPPLFNGYNDWANVDLRQVGAGDNEYFSEPGGFVPGGPGGFVPGGPGGFVPGGPGGFVPGGPGGFVPGGPGGFVPGGPGGFVPGGPGAPVDIDSATSISVTDPPGTLTASEDASPRIIRLSWPQSADTTEKYNIYRSSGNAAFSLLTFVGGTPAPPPNSTGVTVTFNDTVTCNPNGYKYFVTAVVLNTTVSPAKEQESTPTNTVSTGQNVQPLTGCYNAPVFPSPAPGSSPLQGSSVPITWTVQDASNQKGVTFANNPGSNTLVAIGPISDDVTCTTAAGPRTTISSAGAGITFNSNTHQFSFTWNTAGFAQGCYRLELDLDSGQPASGNPGNLPVSAFQVQIYLSDLNESVKVTTTSLPNASEGVAYSQTLQESVGVAPVSWTSTGTLPPGLTLSASGTISGTPTAPGSPGFYTFTVTATDSIGDFGTQTLTLLVNAVVTNTNDGGAGSLRQAITDVNTGPSGSQPVGILFNIPGGGVQTIAPGSALPALAKPTNLDATTQPGYAPPTPIIELNGSIAGASVTGIHITAGGSTVRALDIHSFSGDGILIDTNGGDVIQGNYVGTDPTGVTAMPNGGNGIQIVAVPNNTVGGIASSMRNIISGNTGEGVRIDGTLATGNIIRGNYIGTNASGSAAVGNSASGVFIRRAPGNSVIGNVVSGNTGFAGITICGNTTFCGGGDVPGINEASNASGNTVQGNLVGTNSSGMAALSNNGAGVSIDGAPNTLVGGTAPGTPNTISFNGTNDVQILSTGANLNKIQGNTIQGTGTNNDVGISVGTPAANGAVTGNTLSGNSISGHAGLGIDLAPPSPNPNVAGGANNYPVISSAQVANGTIMGTLNGPATATFTIEFFSSPGCNTSGNGEGAVFLGSTPVTTDGNGNVVFAAQVAGLVAGNTITATSTDASGTTSEFSACVTAN